MPPRPIPWPNPRKGRDQILPSGNLDEAITSLTSNNPADDEGLVRVRRASIDDVFDIIRLPMTVLEWVNDVIEKKWSQ